MLTKEDAATDAPRPYGVPVGGRSIELSEYLPSGWSAGFDNHLCQPPCLPAIISALPPAR